MIQHLLEHIFPKIQRIFCLFWFWVHMKRDEWIFLIDSELIKEHQNYVTLKF